MSVHRMALALALTLALAGCGQRTVELGGTLDEAGQPLDLASGETWGQSFVAPSDGLSGVAVTAIPTDPATRVRMRLLADSPDGKSVAETAAPVERLMADGALWLHFDPLADSDGRGYYFEVAPEGALRLFAAPSDVYPDGEVYQAGAPQPYDLLFGIYGAPQASVAWHRLLADRPLTACYLGTLAGLLLGMIGLLVYKREA
jgi:hypothetical protein